jgi:hypothetical protein
MRTNRRRRIVKWGAGVLGALLLLIFGFMILSATGGNHTLRSVTYAQVPPNSGNHSPVWQICGFYSEPVGDEHAVHSLEHGVVWITYRPDLPSDQIELLREFSANQEHLIISPYPGMLSLVVVSAWGHQQAFDSLDMTALATVVEDLRNSPDAPEPGGSCEGPNLWFSGGTGNPEE